jgi:exodeoxyribonuclease V alpha subunit
METIRGTIDHIIYKNEKNGFTVMQLVENETICVGNLAMTEAGETVELTGDFTFHATYGHQFKVESFQTVEPEAGVDIERYLASGAIKGIGAALAKKIVDRFGTDTFRVMEEEPERLSEIKGISDRMAMEISDQINRKRDYRRAILFMQRFGISLSLATKIYTYYGEEIYEILDTNPYRLAEDIAGVGFLTADEIAVKAGIRRNSEFRIRCGIRHILLQAAQEGHTCLPRELAVERSVELLGTDQTGVEKGIMDLVLERKLILHENEGKEMVWLSRYYYMELRTAALLKKLDLAIEETDEDIALDLSIIERELTMELEESQREAVKNAVRHGVFILTGGPGTGKTTTINAIIRLFERQHKTIFLAAPTGRAAKRMTEMTGTEARTIHRMLEVNGGAEEGTVGMFERNESRPLEADVIIVDEMSMVDISLMSALLKAVPIGARLILSGDANQLPSVGPGSVLKDLIKSNAFVMTRLKTIFRQAEGSDIVQNAHAINEGKDVDLEKKSKDFFFLKRYEVDDIIRLTVRLVRDELPGFVGAPSMDIQVLTPTRKGPLAVGRLNTILQSNLNPADVKKNEIKQGERLFREGDKVMQNRNNYKRDWEIKSKYNYTIEAGSGIFNGDLGVIRRIDLYNRTVTVEFDEERVSTYEEKELEELELAYALTIHKSQGSEYPAVVIPLIKGSRLLMNRNLLYTAVTRARKCVCLMGDEKVFHEMKDNTLEQERFSGLLSRLLEMEN